jgi:hypothetical protein
VRCGDHGGRPLWQGRRGALLPGTAPTWSSTCGVSSVTAVSHTFCPVPGVSPGAAQRAPTARAAGYQTSSPRREPSGRPHRVARRRAGAAAREAQDHPALCSSTSWLQATGSAYGSVEASPDTHKPHPLGCWRGRQHQAPRRSTCRSRRRPRPRPTLPPARRSRMDAAEGREQQAAAASGTKCLRNVPGRMSVGLRFRSEGDGRRAARRP